MAKSSSAASTPSKSTESTDLVFAYDELVNLFTNPAQADQQDPARVVELLLRGGLYTLEQDGSPEAASVLQKAAQSCPSLSIRNLAVLSLLHLATKGQQVAADSLYRLAVLENNEAARAAIKTNALKSSFDDLAAAFLLLGGQSTAYRQLDPDFHHLTQFFFESANQDLQTRLLAAADAAGFKSWGVIVRVGRNSEPVAVDALMAQFGAFPDSERQLTLEILNRSAKQGSINAKEAICHLFVDFDYLPARSLALTEGYVPAAPIQAALFYFLAEQWQIYEYLDFNRTLLASAYETASPQLRKRILYLSRYSGRTEWLNGLSDTSRQRWLWDMNDADWDQAINNLAISKNYADLWRLAQVAAPVWSARILSLLLSANWQPPLTDDQEGFLKLQELAAAIEGNAPPVLHTQTWPSPSLDVACLALSQDGSYLAAAGSNSTIHIWGIYHTASPLPPIIGPAAQTRAIAFSPNGDYLAAANGDQVIRVFRLSDGKLVKSFEGHTGLIRALSFSPDSHTLFSASFDGSVRAWRFPQGPEIKKIDSGKSEIFGLAVSPDGQILLTAGTDPAIKVLRWPDGNLLWELPGHTNTITSLVAVPRGQLAASASRDGLIILWNYIAGRATTRITGDEFITALAFHPNEQFVLGATAQGNISIWNVSTGKKFGSLSAHRTPISGLVVAPDGQQAYSAGTDGTISSWDLQIFTWAHTPIGTNRSQTLTLVEQRLKHSSQRPLERGWLHFLAELIRWRQRFDVELDENHPVISVGEFDIEL